MIERVYDEKTKAFKEVKVADKPRKISDREQRRLKKLGELGVKVDGGALETSESEIIKEQ